MLKSPGCMVHRSAEVRRQTVAHTKVHRLEQSCRVKVCRYDARMKTYLKRSAQSAGCKHYPDRTDCVEHMSHSCDHKPFGPSTSAHMR